MDIFFYLNQKMRIENFEKGYSAQFQLNTNYAEFNSDVT